MASRNVSTKTTAERLASLLNTYYAKKTDLTQIASDAANAIKSASYANNKISLYRSADKTGTAAFELDLPQEFFLDQNKTAFVGNFTWSATEYPGSEDPGLNGKPVMVLAVKGDAENPKFSFLDMEALVDTYSPAAGDGSTTVSVSGYNIGVNVNLSSDANNALVKDANGALKVDISGKASKLAADSDKTDNILVRSGTGDIADGGKAISDLLDRPETAVSGNLAKFDSDKNVIDTGIAADTVLLSTDISDYTEAELKTLLGITETAGE